jgi:DNA-directed RNA polymerase alpha subunit
VAEITTLQFLDNRALGVLIRNNIHTVEQLETLSDDELLGLHGMGLGTLSAIHDALHRLRSRKVDAARQSLDWNVDLRQLLKPV